MPIDRAGGRPYTARKRLIPKWLSVIRQDGHRFGLIMRGGERVAQAVEQLTFNQ